LTDPDRELVLRCQKGDSAEFESAYEEVFVLYQHRVYTVCLRVTGSEDDALDAAQETMITLARRIQDFAFRSRFSSWVYRIAVNAAIDVRRRRLESKRGNVSTSLGALHDEQAADRDVDALEPSRLVAVEESRDAVKQALAILNPRFSSLLVLRYIEGLSYEEIAETLECSLGTVKSRLNRAHAAMRDHLAKRGGGDLAEA